MKTLAGLKHLWWLSGLILSLSLMGFIQFGVNVNNGDFESGSLDGWTTEGDAKIIPAHFDPLTNNSLQAVSQGSFAAQIGDEIPWGTSGPQQSSIEQEVLIPANTGNNTVLQFAYAVVADDPPDHAQVDKPNFRLVIEDITDQKIISDTNFQYTSQTSGDWYLGQGSANTSWWSTPYTLASMSRWVFRPWTEVSVPLTNLQGHQLKIRFELNDCNLSGHAAYGYLDQVHIGSPTKINLPKLGGNPVKAKFIDPPIWAPVMLWIEKAKMLWICLCIPLLLLLIPLLLWLMKPKKQELAPVTKLFEPTPAPQEDTRLRAGADRGNRQSSSNSRDQNNG